MPYTVPEELNDQNGDIILRSSDQVEFRVFRWPPQHLYPVFSDMFHLPVKLCHSCVMPSALQMPAYTKILAKLSEEAISQVNRSSCSVKTRRMLMQMRLDKTNHQILNRKLPLDHLSPLSPPVSLFLSYCPYRALYNRRDHLFLISLTRSKNEAQRQGADETELCEGEMEVLNRVCRRLGSSGQNPGDRFCRSEGKATLPARICNERDFNLSRRVFSSKTRDAHMSSTSRTVRSTAPNWHCDPAHSADERHVMQCASSP